MRVEIVPSKTSGRVKVIASKSYYIRALILSALCDSSVNIIGKNNCDDVKRAVEAIKTLGAKVYENEEGYTVLPPEKWPNEVKINVGESATLLRLIVPVLAAKGITTEISANGSLLNRPIKSLINILSSHGIAFTNKLFPLKFYGRLEEGKYSITDTTTSGDLSGLLIALPLLNGDSEICVQANDINNGYIEMTLDSILKFHGSINRNGDSFAVKGKTKYRCESFSVEGDWSNGASWLVLGALCGDLTVEGLQYPSKQWDSKIIDLFLSMNADLLATENIIEIKRSTLAPITADMKNNLDIIPVFAVACAVANGKSILKNVYNLKYKESNRIIEIINLLNIFGIKSKYIDGNLEIYGGNFERDGLFSAPNDHRLVMAAAIAGCRNGIIIENAESIKKSYPNFFYELNKLGGKIECQ